MQVVWILAEFAMGVCVAMTFTAPGIRRRMAARYIRRH